MTRSSHMLLAHYDLITAAQTGFLFLAVWWTWIYTTWALNRVDPEQPKVRVLLFTLMIAGLFMSMALPLAFGERGMVFALANCSMQALRSAFLFAFDAEVRMRRTIVLISIWTVVASLFWLGGAMVSGPDRALMWAVALTTEYLCPLINYRVPFLPRMETLGNLVRGGHIAERCALFVIICLGEALLISGASFAGLDWSGPALPAFGASVLGTIGM
jgi:low temperature requirement protein LtrA